MTLLAGFKAMLLARTRPQRHLRRHRNGQPLSAEDRARYRAVGEHHAHPNPNGCGSVISGSAQSRARLGLGGLRQAGASLRYPCRPTSGRRRCGSSIAHSSVFRPSKRVSPAARAARCGGPIVRKRLPGRAAGPADRSHLAYVDAQGETVGNYRLMHATRKPCSRPIPSEHWIADYKTILGKAVANPETSLGRLADR